MERIAQDAFAEELGSAVHGKDVQDRDGSRSFDRDGRAAKSLNTIAIAFILRCRCVKLSPRSACKYNCKVLGHCSYD
jgi:hypothetical protein